jgi:hypothetical protein
MTKLEHAWIMDQLRQYATDGTFQQVLAWVEKQLPIVDTAYQLMREPHNDPYRRGLPVAEVQQHWHKFAKVRTVRRRLYFLKTRLSLLINP